MSNRDRIAHLRAEADAAAREKAAAKAEKAARPKSSRRATASKPPGRVRFVWSVCGPSGKEVQRFAYAQEAEARAESARRTESTGQTHFVTKAEVPVG
jgi:hypothetical protein